jgi:hypothetical protein
LGLRASGLWFEFVGAVVGFRYKYPEDLYLVVEYADLTLNPKL